MWLQLVWLQFEVIQGPAGKVCDGFWVGLGLKEPQTGPKSTAHDSDRTLDNPKLRPHEM